KAAVAEVTRIHEQLAAASDPQRQEQIEALSAETRAPEWDRAAEQGFRAFADEAGLPTALLNDTVKAISDGGVAMNFERVEDAEAAATARWGSADFATRSVHAQVALDHLGPEVREQIERLGLGNNLVLFERLSDHGARIAEALSQIEKL